MESCKGQNHSQEWLKEHLPKSKGMRSIQIAGTNGKGSVVMWMEAMLEKAGYSSGVFTSPHLVEHTERIRLNKTPILWKEWEEIFDKYEDFFHEQNLTMFEMDLWMALDYFRKTRPDFLLMETGLGGSRDAVTAMDHEMAIITHIGMDHMALLGDSLEQIAHEKAGVIQKGRVILCAEPKEELKQIFREKAEQEGCSIFFVKEELPDKLIWPEALPDYQKINFCTALQAVRKLGIELDEKQLQEVLDHFSFNGRFQKLRDDPLLLLDGAHNEDGILAVCKEVKRRNLHKVFFSVLADKQADKMIDDLRKAGADITLVSFESQRLADLHALKDKYDLELIDETELMERLRELEEPALICGSLYFAAHVLSHWK